MSLWHLHRYSKQYILTCSYLSKSLNLFWLSQMLFITLWEKKLEVFKLIVKTTIKLFWKGCRPQFIHVPGIYCLNSGKMSLYLNVNCTYICYFQVSNFPHQGIVMNLLFFYTLYRLISLSNYTTVCLLHVFVFVYHHHNGVECTICCR